MCHGDICMCVSVKGNCEHQVARNGMEECVRPRIAYPDYPLMNTLPEGLNLSSTYKYSNLYEKLTVLKLVRIWLSIRIWIIKSKILIFWGQGPCLFSILHQNLAGSQDLWNTYWMSQWAYYFVFIKLDHFCESMFFSVMEKQKNHITLHKWNISKALWPIS